MLYVHDMFVVFTFLTSLFPSYFAFIFLYNLSNEIIKLDFGYLVRGWSEKTQNVNNYPQSNSCSAILP